MAVVVVAVRVCVFFGDAAVGCPAGVCDAYGAVDAADGFELGFEVRDATDGFGDLESLPIDRGESRRVVSSVFESLQTFDKEGLGGFVSDVGDDAAHRRISCVVDRDRPDRRYRADIAR